MGIGHVFGTSLDETPPGSEVEDGVPFPGYFPGKSRHVREDPVGELLRGGGVIDCCGEGFVRDFFLMGVGVLVVGCLQ